MNYFLLFRNFNYICAIILLLNLINISLLTFRVYSKFFINFKRILYDEKDFTYSSGICLCNGC